MNSRHISLDLCEAAIPIQPTTSGGIGAAEMIKEIVANIKTDKLEILFRMDSGYFDEDIIATIDLLARKIYGNGVPKMLYYRE